MIVVLLVGFGLILGSFVNAFVWRLHKKRNWVSERSECPHCHHVLAAKDLVPVVSWVMLRGKCRYCGHRIEDSPITELSVPLLFAVSYAFWPVQLQGIGLFDFIVWLIILVAFVALTIYDLRWMLLPNKIIYPLIGFAVVATALRPVLFHVSWQEVLGAVSAAVILSGLFYLLFMLSDGAWIGGGDVKLAVVLGLLAGDPVKVLLVLFLASFFGLVFSLPQVKARKTGVLKVRIPFGPFLIAGTVVVVLFGNPIVHWYTNLLSV